jgi:hypothetical protein
VLLRYLEVGRSLPLFVASRILSELLVPALSGKREPVQGLCLEERGTIGRGRAGVVTQRTPSDAALILWDLDITFSIPRRILAGFNGSIANFATIESCK